MYDHIQMKGVQSLWIVAVHVDTVLSRMRLSKADLGALIKW